MEFMKNWLTARALGIAHVGHVACDLGLLLRNFVLPCFCFDILRSNRDLATIRIFIVKNNVI